MYLMLGKENFVAEVSVLDHMLAYIEELIKPLKLSNEEQNRIKLASEEALTNIISYSGVSKAQPIEISCIQLDDALEIQILDGGIAFNPKTFIPHTNREQLGGYGIKLFTSLVDHVEYQRENNKNRLRLLFKIRG